MQTDYRPKRRGANERIKPVMCELLTPNAKSLHWCNETNSTEQCYEESKMCRLVSVHNYSCCNPSLI